VWAQERMVLCLWCVWHIRGLGYIVEILVFIYIYINYSVTYFDFTPSLIGYFL
jgi:hypothetical protein